MYKYFPEFFDWFNQYTSELLVFNVLIWTYGFFIAWRMDQRRKYYEILKQETDSKKYLN